MPSRNMKVKSETKKAGPAAPRCQDQTPKSKAISVSVCLCMLCSVVLRYVAMHTSFYVMSCNGM